MRIATWSKFLESTVRTLLAEYSTRDESRNDLGYDVSSEAKALPIYGTLGALFYLTPAGELIREDGMDRQLSSEDDPRERLLAITQAPGNFLH